MDYSLANNEHSWPAWLGYINGQVGFNLNTFNNMEIFYSRLVPGQSGLLVHVVRPHPLRRVHDHHLPDTSAPLHGLHPTRSLHHVGRGLH